MRRPTLLLIAALVLLYLLPLNDHWAVKSDSALYLSLGRSLAEGRGMEFNGEQWWGIPPGLPLLIAGSRMLVGSHYWLINLVLSLFGLGVVLLSFLTVRRLVEDLPEALRVGVATGCLLAVGLSARLFITSNLILTDVPFTFFVWVGLYAFLRARRGHWSWYLAGSVAFVLATYIRLPGLIFFGGAMLAVAPSLLGQLSGRRLLAAAAGGVLVLAAFGVWLVFMRSQADPGTVDYLGSMTLRYLRRFDLAKLADLATSVVHSPETLTCSIVDQKLPVFNIIPALLCVVGLWQALRHGQYVMVVPTILYVLFLMTYTSDAMSARYFLPVMPMLVYALLTGVQSLRRRLGTGRTSPAGESCGLRAFVARAGWPLVATVGICLAISLPKMAREVYWMRHPAFYSAYAGGKWHDFRDVSRYLRAHGDPRTDMVLGPESTVLHYWSGLPIPTGSHWQAMGRYHFGSLSPDEMAEWAGTHGFSYVVVPADRGEWSRAAMARLDASGYFRRVPDEFGNLAVYEHPGPRPPVPATQAFATTTRPSGATTSPTAP